MDDEKLELPRCSTLFLNEEGGAIVFFMVPCAMKSKLRPIIEHGGGEISSKLLRHSIKLAVPGASGDLKDYFSTDYIFDSVKNNKLQELEKYRLNSSCILSSSGTATQMVTRSHTLKIPQIFEDLKRSAKTHTDLQRYAKIFIQRSSRDKDLKSILGANNKHKWGAFGRQAYTMEEDLALQAFVQEKSHLSIRGNALYKEAEYKKVTTHSWQSMRDHYLKVLRHKKKQMNTQKALKSETSSEGTDHASDGDVSSNGTADQSTDHEDYDKIFDDNLLRLAQETSKKSLTENHTGQDGQCSEKEPTSSQESNVHQMGGRQRKKQKLDVKAHLSEFDGEVSLKKTEPLPKKKQESLLPKQLLEGCFMKSGNIEEEKRQLQISKLLVLKELQTKYNLSIPQLIHATLVNSGHISDTESYLQQGPGKKAIKVHVIRVLRCAKDITLSSKGKETWTLQEDYVLLGEDEKAISALEKKRGRESVLNRIRFMEGTILNNV